MDKKTDILDTTALLAELERLRATAAALAGTDDESSRDKLRFVARLVSGLDASRWERLLHAACGDGWVALPLDPVEFPHLHALCCLADSLPGAMCPVTRALRQEPFERQLEDEVERACRHSSDMALLMFGSAEPLDEPSFLALAEVIRLELGGGETMARPDADHLCIIVPGARQLKARALAERILDHFNATLARNPATTYACATVKAGIACLDPGTESPPARTAANLQEQAAAALAVAPANQARVHQHDTRPMSERTVLVQSGEKHFLFFGSLEQA